MDKAKFAKYATAAAVTTGMAIALPALAPFAAPFVVPVMAGVLSEETVKSLGKKGVDAAFGIFGNLAASAIWESRGTLSKASENQDLLRLLANAYLEAINELEFNENEPAGKILPLVRRRIKRAIETKSADDLLMLFPLDENSQKGDLKYSFANRISSGEVILKMADESFSENELLADEIEISLRRWLAEEKTAAAQKETGFTTLGLAAAEPLPEPLRSDLREKLSKSIPQKIGELVKTEEFSRSWIAFQRLHLQALLKEIHNRQNALSGEDRELLKPLAEKLDRLAQLEGVPEKLAALAEDFMLRFDNLETILEKNQAALLDAVRAGERRLLEKIAELQGQVKNLTGEVGKGNKSLDELKAAVAELAELQKLAAGSKEKSLPDNIPPAIENFVGREEYLKPLLEDYQKGARCFVLHGIGGVGKTELAKRFIEKIAGAYEARIFVDMLGLSESPYSAEKAMFDVVRRFEPETSADISYEQLKELFREYVQRQPTLIFLDNAENKAAVEDLKQARACLIVTSRQMFTLTDKDGGKHIETMSDADARDLLFEIAGKERFADGEADELARLAGNLPMALRPPAALLAEDEFETAGSLIAQYRSKQKLLEAEVPDYHARTVAASFGLSYEKLSAEMQSRWRRLSVFPSDFDEEAIAAALEISAEEATETQKHLRRFSLLDGNPETRRFSLHDLIREFMRAKLTEEESFLTHFLFAAHYASVLGRAQTMQENTEENYYAKALKLIDTEWDNITAGQKWAVEFLEQDDHIAGLCTKYSGYARDFIMLRLHSRTDIEWLELGLKAARKLKNRQDEGNSLGNLGIAYDKLGDYRKAIDYHEQALVIKREIGYRLGESNSLGNLGIAYDKLGDYRKAIDYHEQALKISREIGSRLGESQDLGNLGITYYNLGDYRKAIEYQEQYLEISREIGDRLGESNSLGNLGNAYDSLGEYRKAIQYYDQALEISREIGDRLGEGIRLGNLGIAYRNLGKYRKAIEYYEQSLQIKREIGDRLGEGNSLGNLGTAYFNLGEKEKACGLWKEAVAILEAIESPNANVVRQAIEEYCH